VGVSVSQAEDVASRYDAYYFRNYRGGSCERNARWLSTFGALADAIVRELNPATVLDAGCAKGLLVESLRDRGVDAHGIDISRHAIECVRRDVQAYCSVQSILDPLPRRYDLVVCMEVVEHLPVEEAEAAIAALCAGADDVFFSSTPEHFDEDTHLNVQPVEYWTELFAKNGFVRDVDLSAAAFFPPWAARFRRRGEPVHRILGSYERRLWALSRENSALKRRALETHTMLARQDHALRAPQSESQLAQTVADQQAHLDALNQRLTYMSETEQSLRGLLLDAQEQLLERDQARTQEPTARLQALEKLVEQRTAWGQQTAREIETRDAAIRDLQAELQEKTAWIGAAARQYEEIADRVARLQAVVDESNRAMQAVVNSASWRLTVPLRRLKAVVIRARR
jgi:hypothetical protein